MGRNNWRRGDNLRMRLSRRGSKLPARIVSMTKLTPTTDWLPASWNDVGTRGWPMCVCLRSSSLNTTLSRLSYSARGSRTAPCTRAGPSTAWDSVGASVETRKKILRLLIQEIVVDVVADKIELVIHWQGGDHTRLGVKKNKAGQNRWATDADVVELVQVLARQLPDKSIAAILNRSGKSTGRGNSWTRGRVSALRQHQKIAAYRQGERAERVEVTLNEAAEALSVSPSTILRMLRDGTLLGRQLCKGAPWIIHSQDLVREDVHREADARRSRRPSSHDLRQNNFDF